MYPTWFHRFNPNSTHGSTNTDGPIIACPSPQQNMDATATRVHHPYKKSILDTVYDYEFVLIISWLDSSSQDWLNHQPFYLPTTLPVRSNDCMEHHAHDPGNGTEESQMLQLQLQSTQSKCKEWSAHPGGWSIPTWIILSPSFQGIIDFDLLYICWWHCSLTLQCSHPYPIQHQQEEGAELFRGRLTDTIGHENSNTFYPYQRNSNPRKRMERLRYLKGIA